MQMTLLRYEAQPTLFAAKPSRRDVVDLALADEKAKVSVVNVWRNHAFESFLPLMEPYCAFGRWRGDFRINDYDDTLMFTGWKSADVELIWLDSSRYLRVDHGENWLKWLSGRLSFLRSISQSPIVLATWVLNSNQGERLQQLVDQFPAVYFSDLTRCCEEHSIELIDRRTEKLAGTPVSKSAQLALAREMACHWLPAVLFPPIKAVALDLDNTLHCGILGEEGIDGVRLTPEHKALQSFIKSLQLRGVFIALVSRNERSDVESLFANRQDYPLRWSDFSVTEISWGDKASAVQRIATALRIAPDAVLFVDDNLSELASVALQLPQVHTVCAHADAGLTKRAIDYYPGLWRWKVGVDDAKRIHDQKSSAVREALAANTISQADYFDNLKISLTYRNNPQAQLTRLADLCAKTNQFNLALRRFTQSEVADRLSRNDACVTSVQLEDRLSDSGVIAIIIAVREGDNLVVEELCISCRAMGRQLEDTMILVALRDMPIFDGCREVLFRVGQGPRNQPALDWLARLLELNTPVVSGIYSVASTRCLEYVATMGVVLKRNI
jgi:FkbH-like protein